VLKKNNQIFFSCMEFFSNLIPKGTLYTPTMGRKIYFLRCTTDFPSDSIKSWLQTEQFSLAAREKQLNELWLFCRAFNLQVNKSVWLSEKLILKDTKHNMCRNIQNTFGLITSIMQQLITHFTIKYLCLLIFLFSCLMTVTIF
jgi:hypothetical protein